MSERELGVAALMVGVAIFAVVLTLLISYSDRQEAKKDKTNQQGRRPDTETEEKARRAVVEALGQLGDARAVEALVPVLQDNDVGVRRAAAEALGRIRDQRALDALATALERDADAGVRELAAQALGKSGDRRAVQPLINALRKMPSEYAGKVA